MSKFGYLIVTDDGEVNGTDDRDAALEFAGTQVVIAVKPDGSTIQLDDQGEEVEIEEA